MRNSIITSSGSYLPEKFLTNDDLSNIVDTNDEWIASRTGIKKRHIISDSETTISMGLEASKIALQKSNLSKDDIDMIIVATTTPEDIFPSNAVQIQNLLNIKKCISFDIQAVCSGFLYALSMANAYIKSNQANNILVIGSEAMSRIIDWEDRNTCVLFGDGAGATIVSATDDNIRGIQGFDLHSEGKYKDLLFTKGGSGSNHNKGKLYMNGTEVFKNAVQKMYNSIKHLMIEHKINGNEIDFIISHQANIRILEALAKKLNINSDKFVVTIQDCANTSAASIPISIDSCFEKIPKNSNVILCSFGGGFCWGSGFIKW